MKIDNINEYEQTLHYVKITESVRPEHINQTIIKALDRATPMKPIKSKDFLNLGLWECKCKRKLTLNHRFCPYCGKALDWSK